MEGQSDQPSTFLEVDNLTDEQLQTQISELRAMGYIRVSQKFSKPAKKKEVKEKKGKVVAGIEVSALITKLMMGDGEE